jgi:flavin reductase (DIM6/NTAB) family NADH-FMN oxidoreductase RutF
MNKGLPIARVVSAVLLAAWMGSCKSETEKVVAPAAITHATPSSQTNNRPDEAKGTNMKKSLGAKTLPTVPVWAVGSYDKEGKPNVMTAAWVGICCSKPPCVTVSLRKATYTYGNIMARKAFTVSIPSEAFVKQTDYFGLVSGKDVDKFDVSGLTPVKSELVDAPYVAEFPLIIECKLLNSFEIGLHTMFVGEIVDVKADREVLGEDGSLDVQKLKPFFFDSSSRQYFKLGGLLGKAFDVGRNTGKPAAPSAK